MNDAVSMDIVEGLRELIEDLPDFIFFQSFVLAFEFADQILKSATFAVFHDDIDSEVFLIDLEIQVSENVNVIHMYEGVDFIDDVLFFLGRNRGEGDFLDDDIAVVVFGLGLEEVLGLVLQHLVAFLHL